MLDRKVAINLYLDFRRSVGRYIGILWLNDKCLLLLIWKIKKIFEINKFVLF